MTNIEQIRAAISAEQQQFMAEQDLTSPWGEVSAQKLLTQAPQSIDCLMEPILPRVGVVALVGSSDSGKSTLLRGLSIALCAGQSLYLGFRLSPKHKSVIYISTEDDQNSIASLIQRQNMELKYPKESYRNLRYLFDSEDIINRLDQMLTAQSADLVILDAFADVYTGALNENNQVRGYLQKYHLLAQKHQCLIMFLHHTGKRTESLNPSKHNAIGSQGFEAKMRLMIELRKDPRPGCEHLRHLCIVKGNYLPPNFKQSSFELSFSDYLNYLPTGNRVDFNQLRERTEQDEQFESQYEQIQQLLTQGVSKTQIAKDLGMARSTLRDRIAKLEQKLAQATEKECPF